MNTIDRDAQIAETNQRILGNCMEIVKALAHDPEANITSYTSLISSQNASRITQIRQKHLEARDLCERFDRKGCSDALA